MAPMESHVTQILVVAHRTATSARLMREIEARAASGACRFTLLIPDAADRETAERTLAVALPLMRRAARTPVKGLVGGPDPFEAVQSAVREGDFNEIIVSTLHARVSKWLRRDLITRVEGLGLSVTPIIHKAVVDPTRFFPG
jgi:hypothetical protein